MFVRFLQSACSFLLFSEPIQSFPILRRDFMNLSTLATTTVMSTSTTTTNMDDRSIIKWGIVGLGDVTEIKSGPPFWKCNGSELVAVMRRTPGKAQEFAKKKVPNPCVGYDNLQEFLQHPGLQAVYICTRPGTHLEIGEQVAQAGKACYVEKPVGRCAAETYHLQQLFLQKGLPFYTAYISRAYERTQALKNLLDKGIIGERITEISYLLVGTGGARDVLDPNGGQIPWRLDPKQSGGGLIMDVGCHVLDRIDYLFGPLINIQGMAENRNSPHIPVEDYVFLKAEIGSQPLSENTRAVGAKVECTWDFASNSEPCDDLVVTGTQGSIHLTGMSPNGPIRVLDTDGNIIRELTFDPPAHTAQSMIQAVTDDMRGVMPRKEYISSGENALRTSQVLDKILSSYYGPRDIDYWDKSDSWPGRARIIRNRDI